MNSFAIKHPSGKYWTGQNWGPINLAKEWATLGGASRAAAKLAEQAGLDLVVVVQTV